VVYSNQQIKKAVERGHIVCYPFNPDNVQGSSLDLTLGEWYYTTDQIATGRIYNPFDQASVERYFQGPFRAEPHHEWAQRTGRQLLAGIPEDHSVIAIGPRQRILAHTHEFVGIQPPGTTEMKARSSWGRNGIQVCACAGWGDPGYINRWTKEITNLNDEEVVLPTGERMAQLIFHETGPVDGHYGAGGKYQTALDLDQIVAAWQPQDMLPRSYRDRRRPLSPVCPADSGYQETESAAG
jgi:dCTP deaminase